MRTIVSTLAVALAVLSMPGPAAGSVAAPRARRAASERPEAPPGQAAREGYEVFFAPPTSTLGSFDELKLEYQLSSGDTGTLAELRGRLEGPVVTTALLGSAECHAAVPTAVCGLVITSASVAAVSVNGGPAIPTVPAVAAPYGFRSILYEVQGVALSELTVARKVKTPARLRTVLSALSSSGTPITSTPPLNLVTPFVPVLETREWVAPAPPAQGVCQMTARPFRGLTASSGSVVSDLRPVVGLIGRPFITCVATRYTYRYSSTDESSLQAYMVLDAGDPGNRARAIAGDDAGGRASGRRAVAPGRSCTGRTARPRRLAVGRIGKRTRTAAGPAGGSAWQRPPEALP